MVLIWLPTNHLNYSHANIDAENSASLCTSAESNFGGKVLVEVEKNNNYFARQRGPQWANVFKIVCPNLEKIVRSFIAMVQRE